MQQPDDSDVCATVGCDQPAVVTYLGRARCQECYEDDVADEDPKEIEMATKKKTTRKSTKKTGARTTRKNAPKTPAVKPAAQAKADKPKRVSALDAAVQVLRAASEPMRAKQLITAMAEQGLWTSPKGKTPHATLYAAMLREIATRGGKARFKKVDRGAFAAN